MRSIALHKGGRLGGWPAVSVGVALVLLAASLAGSAAGSGGGPSPAFVDGHVLAGFNSGATGAQRSAALSAVGAKETRDLGAGAHLLTVPAGKVLEKVAQLRSRPEIAYAEPDYLVQAVATPNDPSYGQLWAMPKISAPAAWNTTTGSSGVVVGVVDSGVDYTHPDLAANIWSNPGGVGGCGAGTHGYNAIPSPATCDPRDDNDHGTHVSGTIGAVGNNGKGVAGVNWTTRIMGLKFLDASGSGSTSDAIEAINWAVAAKQAGVNIRVLNNSWGGGGFSQALLDAINNAANNDILFVTAAGNAATNDDSTGFYPCDYTALNLICVAATDQNDALAGFSNYGLTSVDLAAPGVGILSTIPNNSYASFDGTSMATPLVSGAAALSLSAGNKSTTALKALLLASVDPVPGLVGKVLTGGRLNVCKAIPGCTGVTGDFTLTASPGKRSLARGSSTSYTVTLSPNGGFLGPVSLSVSGLPTGANASFNSNPVLLTGATAISTMNVTTSPSTPTGLWPLTITGASVITTHTATTKLRVTK